MKSNDRPNRLKNALESPFGGFPYLVRIRDSCGQEFEFGKGAQHWCEKPLVMHLKTPRAEKATARLDGLEFLELFRTGQIDLSGNLYLMSEMRDHLGLTLSPPQLLAQVVRARLLQFQNLSLDLGIIRFGGIQLGQECRILLICARKVQMIAKFVDLLIPLLQIHL